MLAAFLCAASLVNAVAAFGGWQAPTAQILGAARQMLPRLAAAQAAEEDVRVTVKAATRFSLDAQDLRDFGSQFFAPNHKADDWVIVQGVAGVDASGAEVIAVVPPGKMRAGDTIVADARHVVLKPASLPWQQAAALPALAVSCLCPMERAGVTEETARGKRCIVTGGHSSLSLFPIQALKAWGADVVVVSTASADSLRKMGANAVIDFRKDSFAEVESGGVQLVVDTIGRENDETRRMIKQVLGSEYVSIMPQVLKLAVDEGLLYGAGKLMGYSKALGNSDARTYWMPGAAAVSAVAAAARLAAAGALAPASLAGGVGMPEYLEALAWPKDADTGLRYGFPGRTTRSWDWGGGGAAEEDGDEEEDEEGIEAAAGGSGRRAEVLEIEGEAELVVGAGQRTVLFVSANSCRVCRYLQPHYRKLQSKYGNTVNFMHMNAQRDPTFARKLGLEAVPSFVSFRDGRVAKVVSTSNKEKIEELITELAA